MANWRRSKKYGNLTITNSSSGGSHSYSTGNRNYRVSTRHKGGKTITRTTQRCGDWIKVTQRTSGGNRTKSRAVSNYSNRRSRKMSKAELQLLIGLLSLYALAFKALFKYSFLIIQATCKCIYLLLKLLVDSSSRFYIYISPFLKSNLETIFIHYLIQKDNVLNKLGYLSKWFIEYICM